MNSASFRPVILIGGANGTGKTHLANQLTARLGVHHRLGTGFVREIVRSETTLDRDANLFRYSFQPPDPIATLIQQARRLAPAVLACAARARAEGTSLVIEGTHLIPDLYADVMEIDRYLVLGAPTAAEEHERRLCGNSHAARTLTSDQLDAIQRVDRYYRASARRHGLVVVQYDDSLAEIVSTLALDDPAAG